MQRSCHVWHLNSCFHHNSFGIIQIISENIPYVLNEWLLKEQAIAYTNHTIKINSKEDERLFGDVSNGNILKNTRLINWSRIIIVLFNIYSPIREILKEVVNNSVKW